MKKTILPLLVFLVWSCGEEKRLYLSTESHPALDSCILANDFTIICYIDSSNCSVCAMQWLIGWSARADELKNMNTNIMLIARNSDEEAVHDALEQLHLTFPLTFDPFYTIKQNNAIIMNQHAVFAVNKEKEVVWLGLPIANEKTWNLFCKTIRQLLKSKKQK